MTHHLPQLLPYCNEPAGQFCESCRSRETGRSFRSRAVNRYDISCHVDFTCPKGKPWNRHRWLRIPKPGDTAHWLVTLTLVGPLFKRVLRWTGKQCQCEKRRQRWNELGWGGVVRVLLRRK